MSNDNEVNKVNKDIFTKKESLKIIETLTESLKIIETLTEQREEALQLIKHLQDQIDQLKIDVWRLNGGNKNICPIHKNNYFFMSYNINDCICFDYNKRNQ
jgi:hypothetical protein